MAIFSAELNDAALESANSMVMPSDGISKSPAVISVFVEPLAAAPHSGQKLEFADIVLPHLLQGISETSLKARPVQLAGCY